MKMILGFVIGSATVLLAMFTMQFLLPALASSDPEGELSGLIPDITKINREALITPLREAEKTIQDKEIASYYRTLLGRMDLAAEVYATSTTPEEPDAAEE